MALFVARTFLPESFGAARRLARCKVREFWGIGLKSQAQSCDSPKLYSLKKNILTSTLLAIRTLDDFFHSAGLSRSERGGSFLYPFEDYPSRDSTYL